MTLVNELPFVIKDFYERRGLRWPTAWQAMAFIATEIGGAYEQLLVEEVEGLGWVRNNPLNKPDRFDPQKFGEELGDAVLMLMVAGMRYGVNPLQLMLEKMERKLTG